MYGRMSLPFLGWKMSNVNVPPRGWPFFLKDGVLSGGERNGGKEGKRERGKEAGREGGKHSLH